MKTIYFVRHGEAENNAARHALENGQPTDTVYLGGEAPLTEDGKHQTKSIAERAAKLPVEVIVSSTMRRTRETAAIISERTGHPVVLSDLFIERMNPSVLIGMRWDDPEMKRLEREWWDTFYSDRETRTLDGENFSDLFERAGKALSYLEQRPESHILVTTHGYFLRMLGARVLLGESFTPRQFEILANALRTNNTGLTLMKYNPEDELAAWSLRAWNDHAHLG